MGYLDEEFCCSVKARAAEINQLQITAMPAAHKILSYVIYKTVNSQQTKFRNIGGTRVPN